jgi:hypothetical protein
VLYRQNRAARLTNHCWLLSMKVDQIHFPCPSDEGRMTGFDWMPIRYRNVIFSRTPSTPGFTCTKKRETRPHRRREGSGNYGHGKRTGTWEVMIKDHHEGHIGWADYQPNLMGLSPTITVAPET